MDVNEVMGNSYDFKRLDSRELDEDSLEESDDSSDTRF